MLTRKVISVNSDGNKMVDIIVIVNGYCQCYGYSYSYCRGYSYSQCYSQNFDIANVRL